MKGETQAEILSLSQGELTGEQAEILRQLAADEMLTQARIQRVLDGCKVPVKKKEPAAPQFRQKAAPKYIKLLREDILPYLSKENPSDAEITQSIFEALSLCQKEEE